MGSQKRGGLGAVKRGFSQQSGAETRSNAFPFITVMEGGKCCLWLRQ